MRMRNIGTSLFHSRGGAGARHRAGSDFSTERGLPAQFGRN
jgi:hypothetical protein